MPIADRVLVLDAGSTDGTARVARGHGAEVVSVDWPGFVEQKNRALQACGTELVLSLDADEWLGPAALADVTAVVAGGWRDASGWSFPRCSRWQGRPLRHGRWYPDRRVRLVHRARARWIGPEPVDLLVVDGAVEPLDGALQHDPYRSLAEHLRTIDRYSRAQAVSLRAVGARAGRATPALRASWHLLRALALDRGLRDGPAGIAVAGLGAAHTYLKWRRVRRPPVEPC